MTAITTDYEHNCDTWWTNAREEAKGNPPTACVGLLDETDSVVVSDEDAAEFVAWAEGIEGWNEQPFVISQV